MNDSNGMFGWKEKNSAVLQQGGVIAPDERLPGHKQQ